jgi:hypothetical protein
MQDVIGKQGIVGSQHLSVHIVQFSIFSGKLHIDLPTFLVNSFNP